jgi:hypothetical protein
VGKVIGKRGVVITNLQKETNTVINALPTVGESLWLAVVIFGKDLKNIFVAVETITKLVYDGILKLVLEYF